MQWTAGLGRRPREAKRFYATIAVGTAIGIGINFVHIDPIKALFWSAVINSIAAVPLMIVMMIMTMQPKVMGRFTLPRPLWAVGWLSTAAMTVAVAIMFATWGG
jgi:Mn2+/Fe2+ NRAMP family transporter